MSREGIGTTQVKDEGNAKTEFPTGGQREIIAGKGRFDLIPPEAWMEFAQHMEAGAQKYAERNWEKGLPLHTFINSLIRHTQASYNRATDENHEAAMVWNAATYLTTLRRIQAGKLPAELDTRPWL